MKKNNIDCSDIAVIICTQNAERTIDRIVQSVLDNKPGECIVVDAHSTDNTREILQKYSVKVLEDPGEGLAMARQIGLDATEKKFVFFCGDDNVLRPGSLLKLKQYMSSHGWVGAAMLTRVQNATDNYWVYGSNFRWRIRFYEGERPVIGTPYLFYTNVLKEVSYDKEMSCADDSDIEKRILEKNPNYKIGYSNVICYEIGKENYKEMKKRFSAYGKSDYQFWRKYSIDWNLKRKMQSMLHPLIDELILPLKREKRVSIKIRVLPYLVIITFIRYYSWIKCVLTTR